MGKRKGTSSEAEEHSLVKDKRGRSTWERPGGHPGGSTSAYDTGRPRDQNVIEGREPTVTGFTNTGISGSQSGRALHGVAPDAEEPHAEEEKE